MKTNQPQQMLLRTGKPPLIVHGRLLEFRSSACDHSRRWHSVRLFATVHDTYPVNRYAYQIGYQNRRQEPEHWEAGLCETAADLATALAEYDPCAHVMGYPPLPEYAEKQRQMLVELRLRYEACVSKLLNNPEFAEVA